MLEVVDADPGGVGVAEMCVTELPAIAGDVDDDGGHGGIVRNGRVEHRRCRRRAADLHREHLAGTQRSTGLAGVEQSCRGPS